jgi:hypothetical protein
MRVFRGHTRRSKLVFFEKESVRSIPEKGGEVSVLGNDDDVQKHCNNHHV